jgi:hypothetical protein
MMDDDLTQKIIGCAYKVPNTLAPGFLRRFMRTRFASSSKNWGLESDNTSRSLLSMTATSWVSIMPTCG